jgi:hypothetical protein
MRNGIDIQPRHAGALLLCTLALVGSVYAEGWT